MSRTGINFLLYGLFIFACTYLLSSVFNGKFKKFRFKKIHWSRALLYIVSVAMIGVLAEIFVDTIYVHLFHHTLWHYNFFPIHHAYTSQFSPALWGALGFYIYLMHHEYEKWTQKELVVLAVIFSIEAIIVEGIADAISKPFLGNYVYYYSPGNLWHVTSLQGVPFYFLAGILIIETIHWFKSSPHYFTFISAWTTSIIIFFK